MLTHLIHDGAWLLVLHSARAARVLCDSAHCGSLSVSPVVSRFLKKIIICVGEVASRHSYTFNA